MIGFEIFLAIGMFTAIVLGLVAIILVARAKLVSSGDVTIQINGEHSLTVLFVVFMVPRDGIEPPTRGFSIPCSTN